MISDPVLLALITAVPSTIAAIAALVATVRTRREIRREVGEVHDEVAKVHKSVNGLLKANIEVNRSDAGQQATTAERERGEAKAADLAANPPHTPGDRK